MSLSPPRRAFRTLDGLRGVGAFLVVMRHVPAFFGPIRVPESFLAVDLFYLISGFVVAHAYAQRLRAGGFLLDFVKTRVIRLYPLYLLGLALGVVVASLSLALDPHSWWTPAKFAGAIATGLVLIPLFPGLDANGSSLDGPTWTLLPELVANLVYAAAIRFMTLPILLILVGVSGLGVVWVGLHYETLDVGFGPTQQAAALARVGYSFFAGVVVQRLAGEREIRSVWISWAAVAALAVALAFNPAEERAATYELAMILVGFPILLAIAARFEPDDASGRLFSFIGLVSYGVYILHKPMGNLWGATLGRWIALPTGPAILAVGAAFCIGLALLAGWLDRRVDGPVRGALRTWLLPRREPISPEPHR